MNRFLPAAVMVLCVCIGHLDAKPSASAQKSGLASASTEDLIARFQQTSQQSIGSDSMVTTTGFVALEKPLEFNTGILGTPRPAVSPVMRELVRRGVAAVPALLTHLSDDRRTKLILSNNVATTGFGATWFGNEYEPRDATRSRLAAGLHITGQSSAEATWKEAEVAPGQDTDKDGYHVKVGDLCFVTLGQIVNRQLAVARYQPTANLVLSSPVLTPALAAAARADWDNLTDAGFKAFLSRDITHPEEGGSQLGALQRMLFYYPAEGQPLAVALFDPPLCSDELVGGFVVKLLDAGEPKQDKMLADFRAKYGETQYQAVVQRIVRASLEPAAESDLPDDWRRQSRRETAAAAELVKRRFADADKHPPSAQVLVACVSQEFLVDALEEFPSPIIDQAARGLRDRTLALQTDSTSDKLSQCDLAAACAKRFVTPARRAELDRATERLRQHLPSDQAREEVRQAYFRECDTFLRTLAVDPAPKTLHGT